MAASQQTALIELVRALDLMNTYHRDIAQQMVFIRDQLREIDLTLQAIIAYND